MGEDAGAALQVIVLGSGGGPQEFNTSAFLVRSVALNWAKGSMVAVDAGVHLSAITRLIQEALPTPPPTELPYTLTSGPFAGLALPYRSAAANAAHVTRTLVDTYLITHPHLDHISGFVINTAGLPGTRPKKLAGLPSTIQAFKNHIFNNVIWPNLSDENNGAGLLTYLRLVEGGSLAMGEGEGKGYSEVCEGLLVKTWSVSHGHCIERHSHRGSTTCASPRFGSHDGFGLSARRDQYHHMPSHYTPRSQSFLGHGSYGGASPSRARSPQWTSNGEQERVCVYDSSAYFIQDDVHRREVLIFGDVEPDSISLSPRNLLIWQEAAPKFAAGTLAAVFIECSYDNSQSDDRLFGHLKPSFVIQELQVLAEEVEVTRKLMPRKRKRLSVSDCIAPEARQEMIRNKRRGSGVEPPLSPRSIKPSLPNARGSLEMGARSPVPRMEPLDGDGAQKQGSDVVDVEPGFDLVFGSGMKRPLEGLKVIIIHVKENLTDGDETGDLILKQLREHEQEAMLGCEFIISRSGQSFYF